MSFVSLATWLVGRQVLNRRCRALAIPVRRRSQLEPGVLSTSLSLWTGNLLLAGSTWAATAMLAHRPSGFTELGLFNAADKCKTALTFLPQMLFQVTLPMLSHRQAAGDTRGCMRIFTAALASTIAVSGTGALAIACFSRFLMASYGKGFPAGAGVLSLAAAGAVAMSLYTVGASALWALGKPAQMVGVDLFKTTLFLTLCWSGLASSAWNLTLAYLVSFTAGSIVIMLAARRQLRSGGGGI
jgi:O-antigen/teichoic acid export membrane protein